MSFLNAPNTMNAGDATRYFTQRLQKDPKEAMSHHNMAVLLLSQGRTEQAVKFYEVALMANGTNPGLSNDMGLALMKKGNVKRATQFFHQALELVPHGDYAPAHTNLATIYAKKGEYVKAIKHCEEAARLDPRNAAVQRNRARVLQELGRTKEACFANQKALALDMRDDTFQRAAVQSIALGKTEQGLQYSMMSRTLGNRNFDFKVYSQHDRIKVRPKAEHIMTDAELKGRQVGDH